MPNPGPSASSAATQPNSRNTDEGALSSVLSRLRASQAQSAQPSPRPSAPARSGSPGGGSPSGVENAALTAAQRGAIGDRLRECWEVDSGAKDFDRQQVLLRVTTDADGIVRHVEPASGGFGSGVARAFAERAVRTAMAARCSPLPLPPNLPRQVHNFDIMFKP